jgi:hypothetical protein
MRLLACSPRLATGRADSSGRACDNPPPPTTTCSLAAAAAAAAAVRQQETRRPPGHGPWELFVGALSFELLGGGGGGKT